MPRNDSLGGLLRMPSAGSQRYLGGLLLVFVRDHHVASLLTKTPLISPVPRHSRSPALHLSRSTQPRSTTVAIRDNSLYNDCMHNKEITAFIKKKKNLFWWIKEEDKTRISKKLLIEAVLNYGNEKDVKRLFELIGLKKVAEIFFKQLKHIRNNYHPRTIHYFTLYLKKHV